MLRRLAVIAVLTITALATAQAVAHASASSAQNPPTTATPPTTAAAMPAPARPAPPVRILAAGDSVCGRAFSHVSTLLTEADWVGPVTYTGTTASISSGCRSGWTAASLAGLAPPPNWVTGWDRAAPLPAATAAQTDPEVVVINAGINDLGTGYSAGATINNLRALVEGIVVAAPTATVYVSTIFGFTPAVAGVAPQVNALLPSMVWGINARRPGAGVQVVDAAGSLTVADTLDSIHPNDRGLAKLAAVWAPVLADGLADRQQPGR